MPAPSDHTIAHPGTSDGPQHTLGPNDFIKPPDQRIEELSERIKTLEAQLNVADQLFQNVQKALAESNVQDTELQ